MPHLDATIALYHRTDLRRNMPLVRGGAALLQRLQWRFETQRGKIPFWKDDGDDLRRFINSEDPPVVIANAAATEALKDEQVEAVHTEAQRLADGTVEISLEIESAEGPFEFTMTITQAAVSLVDNLDKLA